MWLRWLRRSPVNVLVLVLTAFGFFFLVALVGEYLLDEERSFGMRGKNGMVSNKGKAHTTYLHQGNSDENEYYLPQVNNLENEQTSSSSKGVVEWNVGDLVDIWSSSQNVWAPGFVKKAETDRKLTIKYGLYEKVIEWNSSQLRPRTSLDPKFEVGDLVDVFDIESSTWRPGKVIRPNIGPDLDVLVKYRGSNRLRQTIRVSGKANSLRPRGFVEPPPKAKKKFHDCNAIKNIETRKDWKLREGASHFKKMNFATGWTIPPNKTKKELVFIYNYEPTLYNTRPKKTWEIMFEHGQDALFEFDTITNVYGFCKADLTVVQEYFPKGNLNTFIRDAKSKWRYRKVLPTMLIQLLQSVLDLNSKGVIMCD